jgi:ATP-dependent Clp protease ATP-binding subunit ClpC
MFDRLTDRVSKIMSIANEEARRFNNEYIGTEHILLGLVKEGNGVGAYVLKDHGVDLRKVRLEVEELVRKGPEMVTMDKLPRTPLAEKVFQYAIEESRSFNHNYVGSEHLLLGLLRAQGSSEGRDRSVAYEVLTGTGMNLNLEIVRDGVLKLFNLGR